MIHHDVQGILYSLNFLQINIHVFMDTVCSVLKAHRPFNMKNHYYNRWHVNISCTM